ncbi:hypothetical protein, partial [Lactimicrobium sp.]
LALAMIFSLCTTKIEAKELPQQDTPITEVEESEIAMSGAVATALLWVLTYYPQIYNVVVNYVNRAAWAPGVSPIKLANAIYRYAKTGVWSF